MTRWQWSITVLGLAFVSIPSLAKPASVTASVKADLLQKMGGNQPVAILAGDEGIVAMRADATRSVVIVQQRAAWAKPDARSDVIWFGTIGKTGELWAVDLAAATTGPVQVAVHLPQDIEIGIAYEKAGKPIEGLSTLTSDYDGRIDLVIGGKSPFFRHVEGALSVVDPSATRRAAKACKAIKVTRAGKTLLQALAVRQTGKPALLLASKSSNLRVQSVLASQCEDSELCGQAEPVPGTPLWRVVVQHSCGDACYTNYQLYDPQARQFVDLAAPTRRSPTPLPNARSVADMWISADGTAALMDGALYRFGTGLVKADIGVAAGWLDGQYHLR